MRAAVQAHVQAALDKVSAKRFRQEPAYVTAVASQLEGTAYEGPEGKVVFTSTVFDDHGPGAAEFVIGADLAITATINHAGVVVNKAIIFQAKMGSLGELKTAAVDELKKQIGKMKQHTRSPKIIELPTTDGVRDMRVHSGTRYSAGIATRAVPLPEYFTARVLTTLDGDTSDTFIARVQDSTFPMVGVDATIGRSSA